MDTEPVRELSRGHLLSLLKSIQPEKQRDGSLSRKDLIIHGSLMKALDQIAGTQRIKECGIERLFKLDAVPPATNNTLVYLIPSLYSEAKVVVDHVRSVISQIKQSSYAHIKKTHIILVPRKLYLIEKLFEEEGLAGNTQLHELNWNYIPWDTDLMSMEMPYFYEKTFIDMDQSYLVPVARALSSMQSVYGLFPEPMAFGRYSCLISSMLKAENSTLPSVDFIQKKIDQLFLFDRDIDYASVLLTQMTYEGLVDELLEVKCGFLVSSADGSDKTYNHQLNSSKDEIFSLIRSKYISFAFEDLRLKSRELLEQKESLQNLSVQEAKKFVENDLKSIQSQLKSLGVHIGACESIMKKSGDLKSQYKTEENLIDGESVKEAIAYLEEAIALQTPIQTVLRLICLLSITSGGLSEKDFKHLKREFLYSYGFEHLITFHRLQKLGLFCQKDASTSTLAKSVEKLASSVVPRQGLFRSLVKKLNLVPKSSGEYNLKDPPDSAFVFGGRYVPMICRIVESYLTKSMQIEETLRGVMGNHNLQTRVISEVTATNTVKTFLVGVIGGITYAEVDAFRHLGQKLQCEFILLGTSVITGNKLMSDILVKV